MKTYKDVATGPVDKKIAKNAKKDSRMDAEKMADAYHC